MNISNQIPKDYKPSQLGPIPDDWEVLELGRLVKPERPISYGIVQTGESVPGGIKCIRVTDIVDGKIDFSNLITTSKKISDAYKRTQLQKGDLVMALRGKIGQVALIEEELVGANLTRGVALIDLKEEYDRNFLKQQISSERAIKTLEKSLNGSALQELSIGVLRKIPVLIPNQLQEQIVIATLLNTWDKASDTLTQIIIQKEQRKKWLMQQLLTGKKRLKGYRQKWKEHHLGDFFDERNDLNHPSLPLLSIGQSGVYPQSESEKRDISNSDKSKYRRICKGDIGYNTMRMWQGRSALSNMEGIVSPAYTILKPKKNAYPLFFSYLFHTPKLVHSFYRNSQGLVGDTLNCKYKDFAIVKAFLPEREEQIAIADVISKSGQEIQFLKIKLDKIKEQKRGLMQLLLTGKKRLKF